MTKSEPVGDKFCGSSNPLREPNPTLDELMAPPDPESTVVVNRRTEAYDVYIGRGSLWGNPFPINQNSTREQVIERYERHIRAEIGKNPDYYERRLKELVGKRLGCYCKPLACHGDVLRDILIEKFKEESA